MIATTANAMSQQSLFLYGPFVATSPHIECEVGNAMACQCSAKGTH